MIGIVIFILNVFGIIVNGIWFGKYAAEGNLLMALLAALLFGLNVLACLSLLSIFSAALRDRDE